MLLPVNLLNSNKFIYNSDRGFLEAPIFLCSTLSKMENTGRKAALLEKLLFQMNRDTGYLLQKLFKIGFFVFIKHFLRDDHCS